MLLLLMLLLLPLPSNLQLPQPHLTARTRHYPLKTSSIKCDPPLPPPPSFHATPIPHHLPFHSAKIHQHLRSKQIITINVTMFQDERQLYVCQEIAGVFGRQDR